MHFLIQLRKFLLLPYALTTAGLAYGANNRAIEVSSQELPPQYAGANCIAVAQKLKTLHVVRSEFETSAAYAERMHALSDKKLDGSIAFGGPLSFAGPPDAIESTYDADEGRLRVHAVWGAPGEYLSDSYSPGTVLVDKLLSADSVTLSNPFGATVRGTSSRRIACALAFSNVTSAEVDPDGALMSIPMTPVEAKAAKPNLSLLYVGTLAVPYLGPYIATHKATLDDPHEIRWTGETLMLRLLEVWLYNRATGKVYNKMPILTTERTAAVSAPQTKPRQPLAPSGPPPTRHGGSVETDSCKPQYPARSKVQQETGKVSLSFWISAEGEVVSSKVTKSTGFHNLDQAAREGLGKCTFHPELDNGIPVATWVDVSYRFLLDE
jgi:TonB family protein